MSDKHITINIGPRDAESWFFLSVALAAIAFFVFALPGIVKEDGETDRARLQPQTHVSK